MSRGGCVVAITAARIAFAFDVLHCAHQDRGDAALFVSRRIVTTQQRIFQRAARLVQLRRPAAFANVGRLFTGKGAAHRIHLARDVAQLREHQLDAVAVALEILASRLCEFIALAIAFELHGDVAEFFQIRERGIDHAGAWTVEAVRARFQSLMSS